MAYKFGCPGCQGKGTGEMDHTPCKRKSEHTQQKDTTIYHDWKICQSYQHLKLIFDAIKNNVISNGIDFEQNRSNVETTDHLNLWLVVFLYV